MSWNNIRLLAMDGVTPSGRKSKIMDAGDRHVKYLWSMHDNQKDPATRQRVKNMMNDFHVTASKAMSTGDWEPVNQSIAEHLRVK